MEFKKEKNMQILKNKDGSIATSPDDYFYSKGYSLEDWLKLPTEMSDKSDHAILERIKTAARAHEIYKLHSYQNDKEFSYLRVFENYDFTTGAVETVFIFKESGPGENGATYRIFEKEEDKGMF
jgi:rRNA maturation protein Rpf1